MSQKCQLCKTAVARPQKIDVPDSVILCHECYEKFVWRCECCHSEIVLPEIEGGEMPGFTPGMQIWCQVCCNDNLSECDNCGSVAFVDDMTETDEDLLCRRCVHGYGPSINDDVPMLTWDNWKDAVVQAIHNLPEDLQASVGYYLQSDESIVVTVAGEPIGCDNGRQCETRVSRIEIKYLDSVRELNLAYDLVDNGERAGGGPVISVAGEAEDKLYCLRPFDDSVAVLLAQVQLAILEEMWSGGGMSLIGKDMKGRFIRDEGTPILEWQ